LGSTVVFCARHPQAHIDRRTANAIVFEVVPRVI
jgi:hypothetical protein